MNLKEIGKCEIAFQYLFFPYFDPVCKMWVSFYFPSTLSSLQIFHVDQSMFNLILEPYQLKARLLLLSFGFPALCSYLAFLKR